MIDEAKTRRRVNYYLTLDIMPGASHNEILHAYNRAKNTYSGGSLASYTLMEDGDNTSIMEEIEEAFQILGNPAKRREYDIAMGFNTWNDDGGGYVPENVNPADRLGNQRKARPASANTVSAGPTPSPISSVAASIASIGEMNFDGESTATVIPLKAQAKGGATAATPTPATGRVSGANVGGVDFEPNPEFEKQMAAVTEVDGAFLKAVRIYRRYTPESLALKCKLSTSHVVTLENEDGASMHQAVYLRGHVYLVCQALDLPNPDRLAKNFVERMGVQGKLPKNRF